MRRLAVCSCVLVFLELAANPGLAQPGDKKQAEEIVPRDWLVLPEVRVGRLLPPALRTLPRPGPWIREGEVLLESSWPVRSGYQYGGTPLEHHEGPFLKLGLYRLQGRQQNEPPPQKAMTIRTPSARR